MHDDDRYIGHVKGEHERLSRIVHKLRGGKGLGEGCPVRYAIRGEVENA